MAFPKSLYSVLALLVVVNCVVGQDEPEGDAGALNPICISFNLSYQLSKLGCQLRGPNGCAEQVPTMLLRIACSANPLETALEYVAGGILQPVNPLLVHPCLPDLTDQTTSLELKRPAAMVFLKPFYSVLALFAVAYCVAGQNENPFEGIPGYEPGEEGLVGDALRPRDPLCVAFKLSYRLSKATCGLRGINGCAEDIPTMMLRIGCSRNPLRVALEYVAGSILQPVNPLLG